MVNGHSELHVRRGSQQFAPSRELSAPRKATTPAAGGAGAHRKEALQVAECGDIVTVTVLAPCKRARHGTTHTLFATNHQKRKLFSL